MQICQVDTFKDLVLTSDKLFGEQTFLELHLGSKTIPYSYKQVRDQVESIGRGLLASGIKKGDKVGLAAANSPEWIISYFATTFIGAIVVPIDPNLPDEEIANVLRFTHAKVAFCDLRRSAALEKIFGPENGILIIKLDQPLDPNSVDALRRKGTNADQLPLPEVGKNDIASIVMTSGTTGTPRGVALSHYNFMSNALGARDNIPTTPDDNALCVLPLFHTYPFTAGLLMFYVVGGKISILNSYKPYRILQTLQNAGITIVPVVPLFMQLLYDQIMGKIGKEGLFKRIVFRTLFFISNLTRKIGLPLGKMLFRGVNKNFGKRFRFFACGGAKLSSKVGTFFNTLGLTTMQGYGLTEASPLVTMNRFGHNKINSVGPPIGGVEVKIDKPDENGVGEVITRGPNLMRRIIGDPAATEQAIIDGWLHTGDLGYLDSDGYLYVCGRRKELIIGEGGTKIYPDDVEACYLKSPLIEEICAVGIHDLRSDRGHVEKVEALIVPNFSHPQIEAISNEPNTLRKFVGEEIQALSRSLPPDRRIGHFCITEIAFPRTTTGKLKRHEARKRYLSQITDKVSGAFTTDYLATRFLEEVKRKGNHEKISSIRVAVNCNREVLGEAYDRVLREAYKFLHSHLRRSDLIVSLNHVGFLIVFKSNNILAGKMIATRLRMKAKVLPFLGGQYGKKYRLEFGKMGPVEDALEEVKRIFEREKEAGEEIAV